jgi:hypothetical protein
VSVRNIINEQVNGDARIKRDDKNDEVPTFDFLHSRQALVLPRFGASPKIGTPFMVIGMLAVTYALVPGNGPVYGAESGDPAKCCPLCEYDARIGVTWIVSFNISADPSWVGDVICAVGTAAPPALPSLASEGVACQTGDDELTLNAALPSWPPICVTRSLCLHRIRRFRQASQATRLGPSTEVLGVLRYWG